MSDDVDPVIVGVMAGDKRAWIPLEDHEIVRGKMVRFRTALKKIVDVLDELTDDEQRAIVGE